MGFDVAPVRDSFEAEALIDNQKFDAIFLGRTVNGGSGVELARRARESNWNKTTPIVVFADPAETRGVAEMFSAGATFFVPKPLDAQKLSRLYNTVHGCMLQERRRFRRVSVRMELDVESGTAKVRGQSCNISQDGMLLEADCPFAVGRHLRISFRLPPPAQGRKVESTAAIVRLDQSGRAGVRFTWITREDRDRIGALVDSLSPE